jgi:hypothetical protein
MCGDVLGVCAKDNIMIPPTPKLLALLDIQIFCLKGRFTHGSTILHASKINFLLHVNFPRFKNHDCFM